MRSMLLAASIAAVALYGAGDLVSGLLYEGYRFRDQAISELSAFGSPVRPLMVSVILLHGLLVAAFGAGVRRAAQRASLRGTGLCLVGAGLVGFPTHTVFAMPSRWMEPGFNDTMHIVLSGIFSLFVIVAIVLSAIACPGQTPWPEGMPCLASQRATDRYLKSGSPGRLRWGDELAGH